MRALRIENNILCKNISEYQPGKTVIIKTPFGTNKTDATQTLLSDAEVLENVSKYFMRGYLSACNIGKLVKADA